MKKLAIAIALASTATGVNAFDYRDSTSEGYKPNVETVEQDRALRDAKTYPGAEVELICTIEGVPGKQVTIKTTPWETDYTEDGYMIGESVTVSDTYYLNTMSVASDRFMIYQSTRVDRMTGEYTSEYFNGSLALWINSIGKSGNKTDDVTKGLCVPGKHEEQEAKF